MRELKFRAWDITHKEMFFVDSMTFRMNNDVYRVWKNVVEPKGGLLINPVGGILMQYTGLKDKNGKEIYEGDIIKFPWDSEICVVEYVTLSAGFHLRRKNNRIMFLTPYNEGIEIIGNIYENPKLLQKEEEKMKKLEGKEDVKSG